MDDARRVLDNYLDQSEQRQEQLRRTKPSDSRARVLVKKAIPRKYRGTGRMIITDIMIPVERRKARAITKSGDLRLHLGCGGEHKDGWVNIDLIGDPVEIAWNLARPLPFDDGTISAIFHEHLLEHIPLAAGCTFMRECHRVLRSGGVLRAGVPDAGSLLRSYAGDRAYVADLHPDRPTAMLAVQELFYWHRHTTMFDVETLALLFRAAGFTDPQARAFGETELEKAPDTERRRSETLYMEATKS